MNTLREEWENYLAKCYPNGLEAEKEISVKQGFFAGTFCALMQMTKAAQSSDSHALGALIKESTAACDRLSDEAIARRLHDPY